MSSRTIGRITREQIYRKMESNDSHEIPDTDREETSEEPGLPSGQKNGSVQGRILQALNIDERTRRRETRQKSNSQD